MKHRLLLIMATGFLVLGALLVWASVRIRLDQGTSVVSLTKLEGALRKATRIEVVPLSPKPTAPGQKVFRTAQYKETYYRADPLPFTAEQSRALKDLLQAHIFTTETKAMCHTPGQVLRFYSDSTVLLEASLCLHCSNLEFYAYPFAPLRSPSCSATPPKGSPRPGLRHS